MPVRGVEGIGESGDVREPAEHLGVLGDQLKVDAGEQLIRAEPADHRQYCIHFGIGERRVKIGEAVSDRRGGEVIASLHMLPEADP
jgi:hypothetical protein